MELDENVYQGQGEKLHDALDDAWNKAKAKGAQPGRYQVESIVVEASNPIHSYIVVIQPLDD
jgi:hypothetical protein